MLLKKLFEDDYKEILANDNLAIDEFVERNSQKQLKYIAPISSIYLHKSNNEMFLILDCKKSSKEFIVKSISECESRILSYVNFGSKLNEHKNYLKFNTTLIVMANRDFDYTLKLEIEKSKRICRKIIITVDDTEEMTVSEKVMIPFCFEFNEGLDIDSETALVDQLENLYPDDGSIRNAILKTGDLSKEEFTMIVRWLENE